MTANIFLKKKKKQLKKNQNFSIIIKGYRKYSSFVVISLNTLLINFSYSYPISLVGKSYLSIADQSE